MTDQHIESMFRDFIERLFDRGHPDTDAAREWFRDCIAERAAWRAMCKMIEIDPKAPPIAKRGRGRHD